MSGVRTGVYGRYDPGFELWMLYVLLRLFIQVKIRRYKYLKKKSFVETSLGS